MRFLSALIFFCCFSCALFGQEKLQLSGRVTEAMSGKPLPGATVIVKGAASGCITTPNGNFRLSIPAENSIIQFSFIGFETKEINSSDMDIHEPLNVALERNQKEFTEREVASGTDKTIRLSDSDISLIAVSPGFMEKLASIGDADVMRSAQLVPGMGIGSEFSSGLFVKGGTPDQTMVLYNGIPVYHCGHLVGFFSSFNPNSLGDMKIYSGTLPAKYGGSASGIIDLQGKHDRIEHLVWNANANLFSVDGDIEVPLLNDRLVFEMAGRRSFTDYVKSGLFGTIFSVNDELDGKTESMGQVTLSDDPTYYYYDLNSRLTWFASQKDELNLTFFRNKDVFNNTTESKFEGMKMGTQRRIPEELRKVTTIDESEWGNIGYGFQWKRSWNGNFLSNLSATHSAYSSGSLAATEKEKDLTTVVSGIGNNKVSDFTLSLDNEFSFSTNYAIRFGGRFTQNEISSNYAADNSSYMLNEDDKGSVGSAYFENQFELFRKVAVNAGFRLSYFNRTDHFYFEPRLSLQYHFSDKLCWNVGLGSYNQFVYQPMSDDVLIGNNNYWMIAGVDRVPVNHTEQYTSGLSFSNSGFVFGIDGFYKKLDGLTECEISYTQKHSGNEKETVFHNGTGISRGIDLFVQKTEGNFTGWITYSLGSVISNFPAMNGGHDFYASYDRTHQIKAVLNETYKSWDFSLIWILATGTPYTAPDHVYKLKLENGETIDYLHGGRKNACRLSNYHRLDLSANYHFYIRNARAIIRFSVFNVCDHKNLWHKEFEIDSGTGRIKEVDLSGLGISPSVSFKVYMK